MLANLLFGFGKPFNNTDWGSLNNTVYGSKIYLVYQPFKPKINWDVIYHYIKVYQMKHEFQLLYL